MGVQPPFIVGVSQRVDVYEQIGERRDAIDQRLFSWLISAGFLPVAVPNILSLSTNNLDSAPGNTLADWLQWIKPQGLVLSGGNDIGQCPERDQTEKYLLEWSKKTVVPLLGICRGLQMIADWSGSKLMKVEGHVRSRHVLNLVGNDKDFPLNVNSYHNWAPETVPVDFEITSRAEDGAIESIRHLFLPWEAWMWHPEREVPFNGIDIERLRKLFCGQH